MVSTLLSVKWLPVYKYIYMLLMLLWVARTTPLLGFKYSENPVLMPVYLIIIAIYYVLFCQKAWKPLLILLVIMTTWYIAICIKYGGVVPLYLTLIYNIIIVHVAFNLFTLKEYLSYFEKVMAHFGILALFVWLCCNLFPVFFPNLMHSLSVYSNHPPLETNSVFVGMGSQLVMGIRRNIGFTWEPGRFGSFMILALFVNLVRKGFKTLSFRDNRNFYIFLLCVLSTLSTTCYAAISILFLLFILNRQSSNKLLILCCFLICFSFLVQAPFMMDKIQTFISVDTEINNMMYSFEQSGRDIITPQRFTGIFLDMQNFMHDFWLGYNTNDHSWVVTQLFNGYDVWLSNGLVQIFSKYGVFVGLFFYTQLFMSSKHLSEELDYRGKYIFMILFMAISISYDFWENSVFLFFILLPFYEKYSSINRSYCNIQCR